LAQSKEEEKHTNSMHIFVFYMLLYLKYWRQFLPGRDFVQFSYLSTCLQMKEFSFSVTL